MSERTSDLRHHKAISGNLRFKIGGEDYPLSAL